MGRPVRRHAALFALVAVAAGAAFWVWTDVADWWAYVEDAERGPWPKFKFHWPEQLAASGVVGSLAAAPVALAVAVTGCRGRWRGRGRG